MRGEAVRNRIGEMDLTPTKAKWKYKVPVVGGICVYIPARPDSGPVHELLTYLSHEMSFGFSQFELSNDRHLDYHRGWVMTPPVLVIIHFSNQVTPLSLQKSYHLS